MVSKKKGMFRHYKIWNLHLIPSVFLGAFLALLWYNSDQVRLVFTCSKLTIEVLEQGVKYVHWRRSGAFIVNFERISHLVLVFLLLTLNM